MNDKKNPFDVSIFSQDGKKIASGIGCVDRLNSYDSPKKPLGMCGKFLKSKWKCGDIHAEFEMVLSEDHHMKMKEIQDLLYEDTKKQLSEFYAKVGELVENIMRKYVTPPIKGEITKGKCRWRGLECVWQETDTFDAFVGIRQRDVLILPDGTKIPWDSWVGIK